MKFFAHLILPLMFLTCLQPLNAQAHENPGMVHLAFSKGTIHAHITWQQGPQSPAESKLLIQWMDGVRHVPTEVPGTFEVSLFMPAMGHGSSPTNIEKVMDEKGQPKLGLYEVSNIYFLMDGGWDINVLLRSSDNSEETQSFQVEL